MKEVEWSKNSWSYKFLTNEIRIFGAKIKDAWYDNRLPKDTCGVRKALIGDIFECLIRSVPVILALFVIGFLLMIMFIFTPAGLYMGFDNTCGLFIGGVAGWIIIGINVVAGLILWVTFTTKDILEGKLRTPRFIGKLYRSWKDKVCHKVKIVD